MSDCPCLISHTYSSCLNAWIFMRKHGGFVDSSLVALFERNRFCFRDRILLLRLHGGFYAFNARISGFLVSCLLETRLLYLGLRLSLVCCSSCRVGRFCIRGIGFLTRCWYIGLLLVSRLLVVAAGNIALLVRLIGWLRSCICFVTLLRLRLTCIS